MIVQVCWRVFFATVVEFGRLLLNQRLFRCINFICAAFLPSLSVSRLIQTARLCLGWLWAKITLALCSARCRIHRPAQMPRHIVSSPVALRYDAQPTIPVDVNDGVHAARGFQVG
jgi:hypothetical protein